MCEGVLHICDVEEPKKTGSMEERLEAMEQQVFKCQGMVERRLNANHMMITELTNKHKIDANDIGKHLSRLYDIIDHLQAQIYDLQNQNFMRVWDSPNHKPCPLKMGHDLHIIGKSNEGIASNRKWSFCNWSLVMTDRDLSLKSCETKTLSTLEQLPFEAK
ncbi:40S ribosomal protein S5-1 [Hordeum vulgare]|nr:40S ribosomal protein S5-1 [Hordeum vulgare]